MVKYSNFGTSVREFLTETNTTQSATASACNISQPYLNNMMTGRKKPAPEWVDLIATTLKLNAEKRRELHRAAAMDCGFKL